MNKLFIIAGAAVLAIIGLSLIGAEAPADSGKLRVTASFYPIYFFAREVGGDRAEVLNITPAGAEPHDYELTAQQTARMEGPGLILVNGAGLESWAASVSKTIDPAVTRFILVGEDLATEKVTDDGEEIRDPHVWLSPVLARVMVDRIAAGFAAADPQNADYYRSNTMKLAMRLDEIDLEFKNGLARCSQKNLVTSHAAFGYLARAYGLRQIPIAGISPDEEPSAKQLIEIAKYAKAHSIKYIFFESLVSPKLAETIAREIGAQTLVLNPLEGLSDDEVAVGADYFTEMRANLSHLQTALQCQK